MTRFRVRHAFIDAIQWTGSNEAEIATFTGGDFHAVDEEDRSDDPDATGALLESVHSTWVGVIPGAWVVRGGTGLFFKCGELDFEDAYEAVDDAQTGGRDG